MERTFDAQGIYFILKDREFIIESAAGIIFEASSDKYGLWRTSESFAYGSFNELWFDIRIWISEIASSIWTEDVYEEYFHAVDMLLSQPYKVSYYE